MKKMQIALIAIMPAKHAKIVNITIVLIVQTGWNKTEDLSPKKCVTTCPPNV